jgi:hypothetical protein
MQNVIRNTIAREIRLSSNGHLIEAHSFFGPVAMVGSAGTRVASTDDLVGSAETHDRVELSVELIGALPSLADLTRNTSNFREKLVSDVGDQTFE